MCVYSYSIDRKKNIGDVLIETKHNCAVCFNVGGKNSICEQHIIR